MELLHKLFLGLRDCLPLRPPLVEITADKAISSNFTEAHYYKLIYRNEYAFFQ